MLKPVKLPDCKMSGRCFGKRDGCKCSILTRTSENCKFRKPVMSVTKGKVYPIRRSSE